jgi:hypothetical protein
MLKDDLLSIENDWDFGEYRDGSGSDVPQIYNL